MTTTNKATKATKATGTKTRTCVYRHLRENVGTLFLTIARTGNVVEKSTYSVEDLGIDHDDRTGIVVEMRCFRLTKAIHDRKEGEPDNYDIQIDASAPSDQCGHSCECLGFLRWGHCKHVSSLFALIAARKI